MNEQFEVNCILRNVFATLEQLSTSPLVKCLFISIDSVKRQAQFDSLDKLDFIIFFILYPERFTFKEGKRSDGA